MHIIGRPLQLFGQRAGPDAVPHIELPIEQRLQAILVDRGSGLLIAQVYQYLA